MFQLSLFIECNSDTEALNVLNEVIRRLNDEITSFNLIENESYWKVDGWFKTTCNFESTSPIDYQRAEKIFGRGIRGKPPHIQALKSQLFFVIP